MRGKALAASLFYAVAGSPLAVEPPSFEAAMDALSAYDRARVVEITQALGDVRASLAGARSAEFEAVNRGLTDALVEGLEIIGGDSHGVLLRQPGTAHLIRCVFAAADAEAAGSIVTLCHANTAYASDLDGEAERISALEAELQALLEKGAAAARR